MYEVTVYSVRVTARVSLLNRTLTNSIIRACGDRVHRLEVSSLTSDTRRVADITPTVFLPIFHAGRLPLDALDRRPGGGKSRGGRPGLELGGIQYVHPIDGRTV